MDRTAELKRMCFGVVFLLSVFELAGCKGEDVVFDQSSSSSIQNPDLANIGNQSLDQYPSIELKIEGDFDPQLIKVDAEHGAIYVPQGDLIGGDRIPHLAVINLATGQFNGVAYGVVARQPSKLVVPSVTGDSVASVQEWGDGTGQLFIQSRTGLDESFFDVDHSISDLKLDNLYAFTLNMARNQIHQYNIATGELLGAIDSTNIDDWLIAFKSKKLYTLQGDEVSEFDFSRGPMTAKRPPFTPPYPLDRFGWLSPDENRLYQRDGKIFYLPEFETLSPEEFSLSNQRRTLVDIAFVPGGEKHYTIERYIGIDGDVFLSPLKINDAISLGLTGRRIFVTAAGVHVYAYEDGKHLLYALKQSLEEEFTGGEINIPSRWSYLQLDDYVSHERMYPINLYAKAWPELFFNFDVVNTLDHDDSDQIIVEPICFNEGCATGNYTMDIPIDRNTLHFNIRLADWIQVHDFRGLVGLGVRTPVGPLHSYWNKFEVHNAFLSNMEPAGCGDIEAPDVLVFCDK